MYTKEELLEHLEELKIGKAEIDKANYYKMHDNNHYDRDIYRVKTLIEFIELGVEFEDSVSGCIKILRKGRKSLIYALMTGNWRNEGKNKWYRSGNVKKFVEKFVLDESV